MAENLRSQDWSAWAKQEFSEGEVRVVVKILAILIESEYEDGVVGSLDALIETIRTARITFVRNTSAVINELIKEATHANSKTSS